MNNEIFYPTIAATSPSFTSQHDIKIVTTKHLKTAIWSINKEVTQIQIRINDLRVERAKNPLPVLVSADVTVKDEITILLKQLAILAAARKEVQDIIRKYQYL